MPRIIKIFFILLLISLSAFTSIHKFYVSVTQVDYNKDQQSLQIISRIFIDDIEDLLQERYDTTLSLGRKKESKAVNNYLKKYFDKKLTFSVNGEKVSFKFLGKEYEDDLLICYLEIENITLLDELEVTNQILIDLYEEQQNIIHAKKGKERKSLILEKGNATGMLKFSE